MLAGSVLFINGATSLPALADPCTAPVDTPTQTTCQNNSSATTLTYPASNPLYVNPPGGPFTLLLDNYDVTAGAGDGITFGVVTGGDGTITLENDSDVTSGAGGNGIEATAAGGNKFITVKDTSSVTGNLHGINASTTTGNVTIKTEAGSEVLGTTGNGINAKATTGDVFVETRGKVTSTGGGINGFGISAEVGTGAVTVDAYGDVSATNYTGISATSSNGKAKVTTAAGTTVSGGGGGAGIDAEALTTGDVEVNAQGAVKGNSYGILAAATFGTTMVTTGTGAVEATGGPGIYATASDVGSVTVKTGGAVTGAGAGGIGIHAEAVRGFVEVITNGAPGTLISGTNGAGILAESTTSGLVYVEVHTAVTGSTIGIDANATSGTVEVTTDKAAILGEAGHGIDATSAGTALPPGMAAVKVVTGGLVTGDGGHGINAVATGDGDVKVTANSDLSVLTPTLIVGDAGDGINADAQGTGNVDVEANASVIGSVNGITAKAADGNAEVTSGAGHSITGDAGNGVNVTATGTVTVQTGGNVTGTGGTGINAVSSAAGAVKVTTATGYNVIGDSGDGINASSTGAATVTITNNGTARGTDAGIEATSGTGAISITNNRLVANFNNDPLNLAIRTTGGPTTITNSDTIIGRVITGAGADKLINDSYWYTSGASNFNGGGDTVENSYIIDAAHQAGGAGETTTFQNLENLDNKGLLTLQDQAAGDNSNISDRLETSGNYDANLGALAVDAFLGGAGSLADVLEVGGNVTGVTQVFVTDTNAGPGVYNPTGILVAHADGATAAGDFVLGNGPIDKGLFAYDLVFDAAKGDHLLVGLPDREAFEPLAAVASAQAIWRETADAWSTRQENLRDLLATSHTVTAVADPPVQGSDAPTGGLWASVLGSWSKRDDDASFSLLDANLDFDMSYKQDIYGVVGGADFRTDLGEGGGSLLFGVLAGYVDSALDFDEGSTSIDSTGATLGAYAGLLSNGFFATVLVQADLLNMDYQAGSLAVDDSDSADVTSFGARADLGYRFGDTLFVEPMISVDGFSTKIDEFSVGGADIDAGTNESYRAGAGVRAGYGGETVRASATARVWDVFSTDNEVEILAGVPLGLSDDDLEGVYGDVSGQIDISLSASATAYLKGGVLFSDDVTKPNASGGFAFTW